MMLDSFVLYSCGILGLHSDFTCYMDSISDISNLRILVNFEDFDNNELNKQFLDSKITHLIEISLINHVVGDLNSLDGASTTIYVDSIQKVISIIEDVMLDISMYYSFLDSADYFDVSFRKKFSFSKVMSVKQQQLISNQWSSELNKGYVAIAGFFRTHNGFNFLGYVEFWKKIVEEIDIKSSLPQTVDIESQLKRHKDYGELPKKRILKLLEGLPDGEYYLARIFKCPKRKKKMKILMAIFGGKKLKRGKVIVVKKERR